MKILLLSLLALLNTALAHPVAQGALDLQILPDKILLQARVSGEEIFVARTFGNLPDANGATLNQVWERHAQYWLDHFKILADGRPLTGRLSHFAPARNDFVLYHFEFPSPSGLRHLRLEENVLREIEFAPGNPWEASYIARIREADHVIQEGVLLSPK